MKVESRQLGVKCEEVEESKAFRAGGYGEAVSGRFQRVGMRVLEQGHVEGGPWPVGCGSHPSLREGWGTRLHVGDVNLGVGDASNYGNVDVSVTIGDLDAGAFDVSKGGFFRSWHRNRGGAYKLYAHVGVGDLTLE